MILAENVSYRYPRSAEYTLYDFSVAFNKGEIVGVTGKNGCGKTTMTKLLAGILRPDSGKILIDGENTAGLDLFEIGQKLSYVFQNPERQLFCESVFREVSFGLERLGLNARETAEKAGLYLEFFGLSRYSDDFPGSLSHGEKQRLALAAVLALGTDYLVLDEPTTGLDIKNREVLGGLLTRLVRERNLGVVMVCHERSYISRWADRELVMTR